MIEDTSTGIALAQELNRKSRYYVNPIPVERDRQGRVYVQQGKFAASLVLFPRDAPFLAELEDELLMFPQSKNDDQVDSIMQALTYDPLSYDTSMSWV